MTSALLQQQLFLLICNNLTLRRIVWFIYSYFFDHIQYLVKTEMCSSYITQLSQTFTFPLDLTLKDDNDSLQPHLPEPEFTIIHLVTGVS